MPEIVIEESRTITNPTNLAASGVEVIISGTNRVDAYNDLLVINGGNTKTRVRFGNDTLDIIDVEAKTAAGFTYESGKKFLSLVQENLDTSTAQVAGTIIFVASKKVIR